MIKLFLHISPKEQAERFRERIADPTKNWKVSADDPAKRTKWDEERNAYRARRAPASTSLQALFPEAWLTSWRPDRSAGRLTASDFWRAGTRPDFRKH